MARVNTPNRVPSETYTPGEPHLCKDLSCVVTICNFNGYLLIKKAHFSAGG